MKNKQEIFIGTKYWKPFDNLIVFRCLIFIICFKLCQIDSKCTLETNQDWNMHFSLPTNVNLVNLERQGFANSRSDKVKPWNWQKGAIMLINWCHFLRRPFLFSQLLISFFSSLDNDDDYHFFRPRLFHGTHRDRNPNFCSESFCNVTRVEETPCLPRQKKTRVCLPWYMNTIGKHCLTFMTNFYLNKELSTLLIFRGI